MQVLIIHSHRQLKHMHKWDITIPLKTLILYQAALGFQGSFNRQNFWRSVCLGVLADFNSEKTSISATAWVSKDN